MERAAESEPKRKKAQVFDIPLIIILWSVLGSHTILSNHWQEDKKTERKWDDRPCILKINEASELYTEGIGRKTCIEVNYLPFV